MKVGKKITVLMPIRVPEGNYCFKYASDDQVTCEHFDNEGGHSSCNLGFSHLWSLKGGEDGHGVIKPKECSSLRRSDDS